MLNDLSYFREDSGDIFSERGSKMPLDQRGNKNI